MKQYDYLKAKKYIEDNADSILEASLGMDEDWFWTAETVFAAGEFVKDLEAHGVDIGGISSSTWATPTLEVIFKDGTTKKFNCYTGESEQTSMPHPELFGCISKQMATERAKIERQDIV